MANNKLQLVTFEQAKRLDLAGFNWETRDRYDYCCQRITEANVERDHNDPNKWTNKDKQGCSAPTVALALKWMRDVKGVHCCINGVITGCQAVDYEGEYKFNFETIGQVRSTQQYRTYEQAESALLDELLILIEK